MTKTNLFLLAFLLLLLAGLTGQAIAEPHEPLPRYRVEGHHEYLWAYFDELPYTVISEMCWNETEGYACDERIANSQNEYVLNRIVDFEAQLVGQVWKNDGGHCWLFIWQQYHHEGNPHPLVQQWVECPELIYFSDGSYEQYP